MFSEICHYRPTTYTQTGHNQTCEEPGREKQVINIFSTATKTYIDAEMEGILTQRMGLRLPGAWG